MKWALCFVLLAVAVVGGRAASLATVSERQQEAARNLSPIMQNFTNLALSLGTSENENEVAPISERCPAGSQALEVNPESYVEYVQCIQSQMNMEMLRPLAQIARLTGSWSGFFRTFCSTLPQMQVCVGNFSDSLRTPCTNQEGLDFIKEMKRGGAHAMNYMCFNEGQRLTEFTEAGGIQCFSANGQGLQTCTETLVNSLQHLSDSEADHSTQAVEAAALRIIGEWRTCIVKVMQTCPRPEPAIMVDNMFADFMTLAETTT